MMSGLLGCAEVGDFDEDRDGATYLESTSLLWQADEKVKTDTGRERKIWLSTLDLAVLCHMMGHWGNCEIESFHELYILGRASVLGNKSKLVLQKILGGHFGC